ncbi:MAG: DUF3307 domain-containing protein [Chloroflexi bacterium]|nr:DUF3307 domain-containing protein [Chloroflexota bacterium]
MFWKLLLAHLMGDFLLQTDWMVQNRDKFWVLFLHSSTHLVLMFLMVGDSRSEVWPLIVLLSVIHLGQDALKILLVRKNPERSGAAFIFDQILHLFIIWTFIKGFQMESGAILKNQQLTWVIVAIAYLLITYVWFISERTIYSAQREYVQYVNYTKYSRMFTRIGLVSIYLLIRTWVFPGLLMVLPNPYTSSKYHQRALLTDSAVSIVVMVFLFWALG